MQIVLWTLPLDIHPPVFIQRWLRFTMVSSGKYFPVSIIVEDEGAFKVGETYVVGELILSQGLNHTIQGDQGCEGN